jgi:hypothetical protein
VCAEKECKCVVWNDFKLVMISQMRVQVADSWPVVTYWNAASAVKLWLFYGLSIAIPAVAGVTLSLGDTSKYILTLGCGLIE